jgi:hypothetical protein
MRMLILKTYLPLGVTSDSPGPIGLGAAIGKPRSR